MPSDSGARKATYTYPSTAKVWQTINIGKSPGIPNNLIISGAARGQISEHCLGVVCQTLPVLRYSCSRSWQAHKLCKEFTAATEIPEARVLHVVALADYLPRQRDSTLCGMQSLSKCRRAPIAATAQQLA